MKRASLVGLVGVLAAAAACSTVLLYLDSPLQWAARNGDVQAILAAHNKGENLSHKSILGLTPVVVAAMHQQTQALELLLELGAHDAGGDFAHKPLASYVRQYMPIEQITRSRFKALRDIATLDQAVVSTHELVDQGSIKTYNGSIVDNGEDYMLASRYDCKKAMCKTKPMLALQRLNRRLHPMHAPLLANCESCEDARVFKQGHSLRVLFSSSVKHTDSARHKPAKRMYLGRIERQGDRHVVTHKVALESPKGPLHTEKNWTPFEHKQKLRLIYELEPMTVITPDEKKGVLSKMSRAHVPLRWRYGAVKGGTQAYRYGEHYLTFFYSTQKTAAFKHGYIGAMLFSKDAPFKPVKVTQHPIGVSSLYQDASEAAVTSSIWRKHHKYLFPAGFVLHGNTAYVSYSSADKINKVAQIDVKTLVEGMVDIHE